MTASDHCSSREKTLANRGPSTHEAALLCFVALDFISLNEILSGELAQLSDYIRCGHLASMPFALLSLIPKVN